MSWGRRFFWRATFDIDGIDVGPERRMYLHHVLNTVHETSSQVRAVAGGGFEKQQGQYTEILYTNRGLFRMCHGCEHRIMCGLARRSNPPVGVRVCRCV